MATLLGARLPLELAVLALRAAALVAAPLALVLALGARGAWTAARADGQSSQSSARIGFWAAAVLGCALAPLAVGGQILASRFDPGIG